MEDLYSFFIDPFQYAFLRRALMACFSLSLGCAPLGVLLVLRRMSLMGDALSHAILPGAAVGFMLAGLSLPAMSLGGLCAGLLVAFLAGVVTRLTALPEDASFAGFFLLSLALGVVLVSTKGSSVDLIHVLFGSILGVDQTSLLYIACVSILTLVILTLIWRPLLIECFDKLFLRVVGGPGVLVHLLFLGLVVSNLVIAFQALGTLMALGLLMLPAVAARFWAHTLWPMIRISFLISICSSYLGLVWSYHAELPSGPAIILVAGIAYFISVLFGRHAGILRERFRRCFQGAVLILSTLSSGTYAQETPVNNKIPIVVSFTLLKDWVEKVGGGEVEVISLVGPDGDPHVYQPTPQDAQRIEEAQLVVINGLGMEGWLPRLLEASQTKAEKLALSEKLHADHILEGMCLCGGDLKKGHDPHTWQDPHNVSHFVDEIARALSKLRPEKASFFWDRARRYANELEDLDAWVRTQWEKVPLEKRKVITTHDGMQYYAHAYGIEVHAPVGLSTEAEPSAKDMARIIDLIRAYQIPVVFLENIASPALMNQLASETGAHIGGTLYTDALSATGPQTYIDYVRANTLTLVNGLQGKISS